MEKSIMFFDYESYSEIDIKVGTFRYAQDPSTEIICMAYTFDKKKIHFWKPGMPEPKDFIKHIKSGGICRAFNSQFEYAITNYVGAKLHGWPKLKPEQMECTQADAMALSLPASLGLCGSALGLSVLKDTNGGALIRKLCKPRKPTKNKPYTRCTPETDPDLFEDFYKYNIQDVVAEVAIFNALPRQLGELELKLFHQSIRMNETGVPVDAELLKAILEAKSEYQTLLNKEIEVITEGKLLSTGSRLQSLKWLEENGLKLDGYTKVDIQAGLKRDGISEEVRRFLEIRSEMSRTPVKKFDFMNMALCEDGTLKNNLIYHKATTGRYAGCGFQLHNLPRDSHENPEELISDFKNGNTKELHVYNEAIKLTRSIITAPEGKILRVSDFSSIENRVIAWLAGDKKTLQDFVSGKDQYKTAASGIYGVRYADVTKHQRQLGKISVLACCFGGGASTFKQVCESSWGITLTDEESQRIVDGYRETYPMIRAMWYQLYDKAKLAVSSPGSVTCWRKLKFRVADDFLYMRLPNGRPISYYKPELRMITTPWGQERLAITHLGQNTYTRKWERLTIIPGRLTENAVQATARDILTEAQIRLENAGYKLIGSVHDEIISCDDENFGSLKEFDELMATNPEWALDCPIAVEGYEEKRYRK